MIESLRLRWYGYIERVNNKIVPENNNNCHNTKNEGKTKTKKVIGISDKRTVATGKECRWILTGSQIPQRAVVLKKTNKITKSNLTC